MVVEFDPNVSHAEPDKWASYCPMSFARCRQADGWQTHETRANARRAVTSNLRYPDERDAVLYERVGGHWVERERWTYDSEYQTWKHCEAKP